MSNIIYYQSLKTDDIQQMLSGICVSTRQNPTLQPLPDKPEQKEKSDEQNIFELEKEFGFDNLDTKEKFIK